MHTCGSKQARSLTHINVSQDPHWVDVLPQDLVTDCGRLGNEGCPGEAKALCLQRDAEDNAQLKGQERGSTNNFLTGFSSI
jgi:hypothetical protein